MNCQKWVCNIQTHTPAEKKHFDYCVKIKKNQRENGIYKSSLLFLCLSLPETICARNTTKAFLSSLFQRKTRWKKDGKTSLWERQGSSQENRSRFGRLRFITVVYHRPLMSSLVIFSGADPERYLCAYSPCEINEIWAAGFLWGATSPFLCASLPYL